MKLLCLGLMCLGLSLAQSDKERLEELQTQSVKLLREGKLTDALAAARSASELAEKAFGPEHLDTATSLNNLGFLYSKVGQYGKAEPLYLRALAIREKALGPENPVTANSVRALGQLYREQGQYGKAEPLLVRALAIDEKALSPDDTHTATALNDLAGLYEDQGQYTKAEPLYVRALAIHEKASGPEDTETALSLNNLAGLYEEQGQYAKAEPLYIRSLGIYEKASGPEHPDTATALANLGGLYRLQGRYDKAEPMAARSLAICEKVFGPEHPITASALNNLAGLYREQGQYGKAEPLYARALAIREKVLGPEHPGVANILNNLAELYAANEQYAKAEPMLLRALAISGQSRNPENPATAHLLNNLGGLYEMQKQYEKAEPLYTRALAIWEKTVGPEGPNTATALDNLAELYEQQKKFEKAEPLFQRALAIREKRLGAEHPDTAGALNNLAGLYQAQKQYEKAEPLLVRALAIDEKALGSQNPATATMVNNLTLHYLDAGKPEQAREVLAKGWPGRLKYLEQSLQFGRASFRRKLVESVNTQLSLLIDVQGDNPAIRELGLRTILASKVRVSEETEAALQSLRERLEPDVKKKLDELTAVQGQQSALGTPRTPAQQAQKDELSEQEDRLVAELTTRSVEFREANPPVDIDALRGALASGALVELVIYKEVYVPKRDGNRFGPPRYGAYVLTSDGKIQWRDLGAQVDIDRLVARYRYTMNVPDNRSVNQAAARQIDALVLEPIRKSLPAVTEFFVAADGQLRLFPLAALRDSTGTPLIEKYQIHTLATGRDLLRRAPIHSVQPPWVGGIGEFGKAGSDIFFPAIPGATQEAEEVGKEIRPKPQMLTLDQMTKEFLMHQMHAPRILHLATHGYYHDREGGLALRNANVSAANILNQNDAAKLNLFGTQLVVLSACETGLGEVSFADGVTGLQRSLTLAGARSQILTLWPVNDAKTRELMVAFYRNLFDKRMTKSEALRQAQIEMAKSGVDAYYWAPFVLYGDGGALGQ